MNGQENVVEELIQEIVEARTERLKEKIKSRPPQKQPYLYLSNIHTCARNNYYQLMEGDKRKAVDEFLQAKFDACNQWENQTIRDLMEMGFEIVEGQVVVEIRHKGELIAKGKVDGKFSYKKLRIPTEIKSLDPNVWARINEVDDLFKNEWTAKYVRQLLMYLYGHNEEAGLFLINDRAGHWKILALYLGNYLEVAERTLQLIEQAWAAKKKAEKGAKDPEPKRISYHHKICGSCQFNAICLPTSVIEGGITLEDPEIEAMLLRHEELYTAHMEFKEIHETVGALFKEKPETTVSGRYRVVAKKQVYKQADTSLLTKEQKAAIMVERVKYIVEVEDLTKKPEVADGSN